MKDMEGITLPAKQNGDIADAGNAAIKNGDLQCKCNIKKIEDDP